jgi:LysR family glycine cleavage system transcriptional activator
MPRKLPPLNAVRAFEAAGRYLSFTGASQELLVTQSAVSRHVSTLEDWLGAKLFFRRQRGIELTPRGEAYYRALSIALDQIDVATRRMRDDAAEKVLRLKLPPTFAIRWLAPRLAGFHALHPEIDIQVTTSHSPGNFDREDVDVFVQSEFGAPTEGYKRLFGEVLLPVCSPRLLERGPALDRPADLAGHTLLSSMHRPRDWPLWLAAAGITTLEARGAISFDNAALAYQAAIDGLGVVMAQRALIEEDLNNGRLIAPFERQTPTPGAYYLAFNAGRPKPPRVAAFEAWLLAEAAKSEGGAEPRPAV